MIANTTEARAEYHNVWVVAEVLGGEIQKVTYELLGAARSGTDKAYADDHRPTADIRLPQLDEHTLGQLFQMLMIATVAEGRLIGINPYGQPGVEAYKRNMNALLRK